MYFGSADEPQACRTEIVCAAGDLFALDPEANGKLESSPFMRTPVVSGFLRKY
jgi:hypothetical protein